ncbi:hypothetical protein [Vibrio sp. CAU 1672]|uniref:hypothetical protein n=1 Tax=Vibrio sp. CAU 1672 TaxID=3032594 RepID=UPI0023DBDE4B|nr:hypothetical protein [Vibrio sp. CAU 1672]MDF2155215.1 hypothetical protein [Vibrio sp. CAU 1672]
MNLHTCIIMLSNQRVITSNSVEYSLKLLETNSQHDISEIQINATDGATIHTYHYHNVEESLESLMNL